MVSLSVPVESVQVPSDLFILCSSSPGVTDIVIWGKLQPAHEGELSYLLKATQDASGRAGD